MKSKIRIKTFILYKFLLLTSAVFITACSSVKIINVNDVEEFKKHSIIYSLPKTIIDVEVKTTKTIYKKGPYYNYAKKYLGINNVIINDKTEWNINDIDISDSFIPDTDNYYLLYSNKNSIARKINLTDNGIIKSFNVRNNDKDCKNKTIYYKNNNNDNIDFYDLTIKKHFEEVFDTTYKIIRTDSSVRKIPVYSKRLSEKGLEKKAEEAADFIIKIRKRRLRILTGKDDIIPNGEAAKSIIDELNLIEKRYLELFTGVERSEKIKYYFKYEPKSELSKPEILFKFSTVNGIDNIKCKSCTPYYISVKPYNYTTIIDSLFAKVKKPVKQHKGIIYRMPENSIVEIFENRKLIAEKNILINQFGVLNLIPATILKNNNIEIDFFDKNGALKGISSNLK